ncbi:MAG: ATP-binding protein [Pseudomonadota bacterium]|nr:ATP-binding protein [Pseudomonadota bacterium]
MKLSLTPYLPRSLMGRSLLILILPVLLIQLFSTFMFFDRHWNRMADRLAYAVAGEIGVIEDRVSKIEPLTPQSLEPFAKLAQVHLQLLLSFEEGAKLEHIDFDAPGFDRRSFIYKTLTDELRSQLDQDYVVNVDGREKWVEVGIQFPEGVLYISMPERRLFSSSSYIFVMWMIGSSVVLLALAILFMRNQIRPIRRLAIAAERLGRGEEMAARFKPEGAREIRQAGHAFMEMSDRIKRQIEQRSAMLAGISHDLRTPLTRMKLQASMMGDTPDTQALKKDIHDMERMINAYLDFTRDETGEETEHTDLTHVLEDLACNVRREGIDAELDVPQDLMLRVRPLAFQRCLNNLVSNARKYGAKTIWISASKDEKLMTIFIDDNGPGIPEDQLEEVFKPFYRIDPSRNQDTGGVGLGLPIVQDIIHRHGGEITLGKSPYGGLRAMITMPA